MSVLSYLGIAKLIKKRNVRVDTSVNKLHYRLTSVILLICSMLVGAKEFFGSPIMCHSKSKSIKSLLNTYCYIMSTFSIPTNRSHEISRTNAYHGAGTLDPDDEVTVHGYYIWIPMMLALQAGMFYFPHFIWKKIDANVFETVMDGLDKFSMDFKKKESKIKKVVEFMMHYLHTNNSWYYRFFICEALNFINVILNLFLINWFLGGTFFSYGTEVLNYPYNEYDSRADPMSRIFPKMAKCTFRKFGPSGTMETHDAFCLLAVNIINEKIYLFLWFWLIILSAITGLWLMIRGATFFVPALRFRMLQVRGRWAGIPNLKVVVDTCSLGDWFLIYQMGAQMEPTVFGEFIKELAKELQNTAATLERKPMLMDN